MRLLTPPSCHLRILLLGLLVLEVRCERIHTHRGCRGTLVGIERVHVLDGISHPVGVLEVLLQRALEEGLRRLHKHTASALCTFWTYPMATPDHVGPIQGVFWPQHSVLT